MTSNIRTQVYLPPDEHRRLKRLAAERNVALTEVVREAVARYLTEEGGPDSPSLDDAPPGPEGLVARMRARRAALGDQLGPAPSEEDREIVVALLREIGRNS